MAINEQYRQLEIVQELEAQARALAHSTRAIPNPPDSYDMLAELGAALSAIEQVAQQIGWWHREVVDGEHYQGEDERGDGATSTIAAAAALDRAAAALHAASTAVSDAHSANGVVRWIGTNA